MHPVVDNIPAVSILLMMLTGIISTVPHNRKVSYWMNVVALSVITAANLCLLFALKDGRYFTYSMGQWGAPWGNELRAGPLEALMGTLLPFVMLLSVLGGRKDTEHDVLPQKQGSYYIILDLLMASLLALIYTNDIFTGYVFIEINTITACALVMAKEEGRTLAATLRYLLMSLVGSSMFLMGVALLYGITGELLMESIAPKVAEIAGTGSYLLPLAALICLMVCGLSIKSALYPFSIWSPDAYGTATTSSSAVLSGLVSKGYIILLIKIFVRCFKLEVVNSLGITILLFILGMAAMIMGSVDAIKATNIKRMLAYSSIAQIGYIFMGIGLGTEAGITAACFQIVAHTCTKPLLFTCAGRLSTITGYSSELKTLRGTARKLPLAGIGFTVGALSMIGIPLFAGFTVKIGLAEASYGITWKMLAVLAVLGISSVLNAMYYIPALLCIWSADGNQATEAPARDTAFAIAAIALIACIFALGIFFRPVMNAITAGFEML